MEAHGCLRSLDFYRSLANIFDSSSFPSARRSATQEALRLIAFAAKRKQVHEKGFSQGNQICGIEPNEPPPLLLHPFLQMPGMFICLIPNYGSTSIACLPSLLTRRLEILKNKKKKEKKTKMLCFSDRFGAWLITKQEQKFNFTHGWAQQRGGAGSVILPGFRIALGAKPRSSTCLLSPDRSAQWLGLLLLFHFLHLTLSMHCNYSVRNLQGRRQRITALYNKYM